MSFVKNNRKIIQPRNTTLVCFVFPPRCFVYSTRLRHIPCTWPAVSIDRLQPRAFEFIVNAYEYRVEDERRRRGIAENSMSQRNRFFTVQLRPVCGRITKSFINKRRKVYGNNGRRRESLAGVDCNLIFKAAKISMCFYY